MRTAYDESKEYIAIPDNSHAFKDWIDKKELKYVDNGHFTLIENNPNWPLCIFTLGKEWGVYNAKNNPVYKNQ